LTKSEKNVFYWGLKKGRNALIATFCLIGDILAFCGGSGNWEL